MTQDLNLSYGLYNSSIFLSAVYFIFCILSILGIGAFLKKIFKFNKIYIPIYGISFCLILGGFFSLHLLLYNLFLYFIIPFGFYYFFKELFSFNFIVSNKFFLFLITLIFFVSFFQFNYGYDDLEGYFPIYQKFLSKNFFINEFDYRKFNSYPSIYFLNSLFLENGNLYQSKFVDIFFGCFLTIYFLKETLSNNFFFKKHINILLSLFFIIIFSIGSTVTPHILIASFIFIVLHELNKYLLSEKNENLINFFIFSFVTIIISFKAIFFIILLFIYLFLDRFRKIKTLIKLFFLLSLVVLFPWSFYSFINFKSFLYSITGEGLAFNHYKEILVIRNNPINNISYFFLILEKIKFVFLTKVPKFDIYNSIFFLFLATAIVFFDKKNKLVIYILIYLISFLSYILFDQTTLGHIFRYIYPITIGLLLFFITSYLKNNNNINNYYHLLIIFIFATLSFEKVSIKSQINNISNIFFGYKIPNVGHQASNLYPEYKIKSLLEITKNIKNQRIMTFIDSPYLLDYKKNKIYNLDYQIFYTSPEPGYPVNKNFEDKINYFKSHVDYILVDIKRVKQDSNIKLTDYKLSQYIDDPQDYMFRYLRRDFAIFLEDLIKKNKNSIILKDNFYLIRIN